MAGSVYVGRRARILIADDHTLIAEAFKGLLEPEFEVVGIVPDGRMLMEAIVQLQPDVVILDISMPELNGLDAGTQVKAERRAIKLVYVTVDSRPEVAAEAFRRGASGFVLKHGAFEEMRIAVRRAIRGETYLSSLLDKEEVDMHRRLGTEYSDCDKISFRQREVLQLLAEGKSMKEVAFILAIKPGTVAFHKYRMMERLGIKTNAGLYEFGIKNHIACNPSNQI
jgi:DNA-binding NarL/FixJ family response regulator